jgi:hypothetical protein
MWFKKFTAEPQRTLSKRGEKFGTEIEDVFHSFNFHYKFFLNVKKKNFALPRRTLRLCEAVKKS